MNATLQKRTRQLSWYLAAALLLFTLLATGLGLLIRKEQSLLQMVDTHRKIAANLPLMRRDNSEIRQQLTAFQRLIPSSKPQRSNELLLFSRLDQIRQAVKPLEITVTPPENKDTALSITFTMKLPLQSYSETVNAMGLLQRETFPFVVFRSVAMDTKTGGLMNVEGSVIMPLAGGAK